MDHNFHDRPSGGTAPPAGGQGSNVARLALGS